MPTLLTSTGPPLSTDARCVFEHPVFGRLGSYAFRPAEADRMPVLVMPLGAGVAALPLMSLQQELGIASDSPDGRMLAQIARALDFVGELRPGDALPVEVLCGEASWQPEPLHREIAGARLWLQLTTRFDEAAGPAAPAASAAWSSAGSKQVLQAAGAPGMRLRMQAATTELAATLGLPDATAAKCLVDDMAHELSFVEALRARLLDRVIWLRERVETLLGCLMNNLSGLEQTSRVRRLIGVGLGKIRARFNDLESLTGNVVALLQDVDARRAVIRLHRDWLYCSLRAWEGVLCAWESASPTWSDETWPLLSRTYRFLAPRFMPMQEWLLTNRAGRPDALSRSPMVW